MGCTEERSKGERAQKETVSMEQEVRRGGDHYRATIRRCNVALVCLLLIIIVLVWMITGLSMRAGMIPYFDLGYSWFDQTIFVFFGL